MSDEYGTPPFLMDAVRKVFDYKPFLDLASSKEHNETVKADFFYSKDNSALAYPSWAVTSPVIDTNDWSKHFKYYNVFCNPPYSQPLCRQFVRMVVEIANFHGTSYNEELSYNIILLINTSSSSQHWQFAYGVADSVFFPASRIQFMMDGKVKKGNRHDQTICYFGTNPKLFQDVMADVKWREQ